MSYKLVPVITGTNEGEITLFIHGYTASNEEYYKARIRETHINTPGDKYLLIWDSGNWGDGAFKSTLGIAGVGLGMKLFASAENKEDYAAATLTTMISAGIGAWGVSDIKNSFENAETQARRIAKKLKIILKKNNLADSKINLVGHSLGAYLIHWALATNSWSDFDLNDCLFLGGAADREDEDWESCLKEIGGRIFNVYSNRDEVLGNSQVVIGERIGDSNGMPISSDRIKELQLPYGHTDYWLRLPEATYLGWQCNKFGIKDPRKKMA